MSESILKVVHKVSCFASEADFEERAHNMLSIFMGIQAFSFSGELFITTLIKLNILDYKKK